MSEKATHSAIARREKSAWQFDEAHPLLNGVQSMGMDWLKVLDSFAVLHENEPRLRIPLVLKEEIEEVLLPHTEKWFRQHQETPFRQGDRCNSLGYDCTLADVQDLMKVWYNRELEKLTEEGRSGMDSTTPNKTVCTRRGYHFAVHYYNRLDSRGGTKY
jgi:hypothetical protein